MTCQQPGDRRVCDAKSAGGLSDAGSVVYRRASCPQVLVGQHSKAGAGVNTGCDESLPNRLDVEPVLLRNLHLSQTGRVIGHERRVRRNWLFAFGRGALAGQAVLPRPVGAAEQDT